MGARHYCKPSAMVHRGLAPVGGKPIHQHTALIGRGRNSAVGPEDKR